MNLVRDRLYYSLTQRVPQCIMTYRSISGAALRCPSLNRKLYESVQPCSCWTTSTSALRACDFITPFSSNGYSLFPRRRLTFLGISVPLSYFPGSLHRCIPGYMGTSYTGPRQPPALHLFGFCISSLHKLTNVSIIQCCSQYVVHKLVHKDAHRRAKRLLMHLHRSVVRSTRNHIRSSR